MALSGGADSLALAAATAFEAPKLGLAVRSVTVDHALQPGSAEAAADAAAAATALGIDAAVVRVTVGGDGGPEAAARDARYRALAEAAQATPGTVAVLLGHTLDDQAETVLLGLARGSGASSLAGMAPARRDEATGVRWLRPLLAVRRDTARAACAAAGLTPWDDPHNTDSRFARVRVRERVLPVLESELGPGVAEALARTAEQLREDAEAFAEMIDETIEDIVRARRSRHRGVGRRARRQSGSAAPPHHPARGGQRVRRIALPLPDVGSRPARHRLVGSGADRSAGMPRPPPWRAHRVHRRPRGNLDS